MSEELSSRARERILAAWASAVGTPPDELRRGEETIVERPDLAAVIVAEVDGHRLVAAPPIVVDTVRAAAWEALIDAHALARMLPVPAAPIGTADLLFTERRPDRPWVRVTEAGPADLRAVRTGVAESEWQESGLDEMHRAWVSWAAEGRPAAVAGFSPWHTHLAQLGVIARAEGRRAGFASAAAATAVRAAIEAGLIAQWRSRRGNDASMRLGQRLGFVRLGVQSAAALTASRP
ncbi:GNAT family N-acetyltransferase [Microbacter sp. GSS18]|nr:GNAT family N-acetyltransferase [Microbacter sp. GSS18]